MTTLGYTWCLAGPGERECAFKDLSIPCMIAASVVNHPFSAHLYTVSDTRGAPVLSGKNNSRFATSLFPDEILC